MWIEKSVKCVNVGSSGEVTLMFTVLMRKVCSFPSGTIVISVSTAFWIRNRLDSEKVITGL